MPKDTPESISTKITGLTKTLEDRKAQLKQMQLANVKYQHQQGTKDDIYRLHREISELRNDLAEN